MKKHSFPFRVLFYLFDAKPNKVILAVAEQELILQKRPKVLGLLKPVSPWVFFHAYYNKIQGGGKIQHFDKT